jgi:predicted nucleic acid-binding protein
MRVVLDTNIRVSALISGPGTDKLSSKRRSEIARKAAAARWAKAKQG